MVVGVVIVVWFTAWHLQIGICDQGSKSTVWETHSPNHHW